MYVSKSTCLQHTLDVTHTPDNQTTNLTQHSSVHIQHPHVFEHTTTASTCHQQQWVLLSSEGTSNTTDSMGSPCRWPGTSSGVQFGPVLRKVKTHSHVHNVLQLHATDDHAKYGTGVGSNSILKGPNIIYAVIAAICTACMNIYKSQG